MSNVIKTATNKFTKGLVMDFSPENTSNEVLTHALNATLLTFNGNEMSLQNDMGNGRVETAFLPEGYMPVGTCEYGGIIYIVSYNPLEDKSQIGCFPSPERNFSNEELGELSESLSNDDFQENDGSLKTTSKQIILKQNNLNPGDKFIISTSDSIYDEKLLNLKYKNDNNELIQKDCPLIMLNIVSIEDNGKINYLTDNLRQYEYFTSDKTYYYHIIGKDSNTNGNIQKIDIDSYRNVLSSGYNVFKSKVSGKLAILAELITIDSYSITHSIKPTENEGEYKIIIHTEVSPELNKENYNIIPKLKYYYLKESQVYLSGFDNNDQLNIKLFTDDGNINYNFKNYPMWKISYEYKKPEGNEIIETIGTTGEFNFNTKNKYYDGCNNNDNSNLIEKLDNDTYKYKDYILGTIKLPDKLYNSNVKMPIKYDYTLVPCMEYGRLDYLAISNTIDFSKINDFNASNFNVWKYRIDENQLRLTFGAEIYGTEEHNVNALILEFYDLWGFVGSLEITNKSSYSGIFTKLLNLNKKGILNNKKINNENNGYIENFVHNINIFEKDNNFYLENISDDNCIIYNEKKGWEYENNKNIIENDCGTLFTNMIYGVKAYLRETTNEGLFFTKKNEFFLFTFPIYNDYYYTVNNYNTLIDPKLDLILTYKLQNFGKVYDTNENINDINLETNIITQVNIKNGYNTYTPIDPNDSNKKLPSDKENYETYIQGIYEGQNLELTKYYTYEGTTNLSLEIGLKEEYKEFNIGYDLNINKDFSCNLQLISDRTLEENNKIQTCFSINSTNTSITDLTELLNYTDHNKNVLIWENKLGFDKSLTKNSNEDTQTIKIESGFENYNFLNQIGTKTIPINYKFIVGYKAYIYNIQSTAIPVTTVTSLLYKNSINSEYNYSDFSIYKTLDSDNNEKYYSEAIYYNGGTASTEEFGICKQVGEIGDVREICTKIGSMINTDANDIKTHGYMNSENISEVVPLIGKLTFCMPHLHNSFNENYGVNIHISANDDDKFNISNNLGDIRFPRPKKNSNPDFVKKIRSDNKDKGEFSEQDLSYGIAVSNEYFFDPRFNMVLNTYKSLEQNSEFISTINYNLVNGRQLLQDLHSANSNDIYSTMWLDNTAKDYNNNEQLYRFRNREFTGLTAKELPKFNKKLLQTMKGIYAYNPDYDTMNVNIGNILIENLETKFNSNIISSNAELKLNQPFNNFIGFRDNNPFNNTTNVGNITFAKYFEFLNKHSTIKIKENNEETNESFLPIINFQHNLKFCGKGENYLVSQLTYNVPIPSLLEQELMFNNDKDVHIIHSNGYRTKIQGNLNKKALYAYVDNKLIQLDVSNYKIAIDGTLGISYYTDYIVSGYTEEYNCENNKLKLQESNLGQWQQPLKYYIVQNKQSKINSIISENNIQTSINNIQNYDSFNLYNSIITNNTIDKIITTSSSTNNITSTIVQGKLDADQINKIDMYAYYTKESIIASAQTSNYSKIEDGKYKINEKYINSVFRGTSLTINDLYYDPKSEKHRLFIKKLNGEKCRCEATNNPRNIIFYRELPSGYNEENISDENKKILETWDGRNDNNKYQHKNHLYLYTGPCFTSENLIMYGIE